MTNPDRVYWGNHKMQLVDGKITGGELYYRAEPVETLLKQALDALDNIAGDMYDDSKIRPILTAIDQFLTTTKGD